MVSGAFCTFAVKRKFYIQEELVADFKKQIDEILGYSIAGVAVEVILRGVIVFVIGFVVAKLILVGIKKLLFKSKIDKTLHTMLYQMIRFALYFVVILTVVSSVGIPVTSFLALFSVVGLALSLSIQTSLGNVASGITILLTKPFQVGDFIEASSITGTVHEINLVYTKLYTADNKVVFIPNSEIGNERITNFSSLSKRRAEVKVTASYDNPIKDVKEALHEAIDKVSGVLRDEEIFVAVSAYQESAIEYTIRVWVDNEYYWSGYYELIEEIKNCFDAHGIEMTYNHLNVHMDMKDNQTENRN